MNVLRSFAPAALAAFVLACACSKQATTASSTSGAAGGVAPDRVVATYNGGKITAGELEKEARPQIAELENKMYQARKQALEQMAMERIIKAEAAKANLSEQDYIRKRVEEAPVQQPTEAQERQFYERLKSGGQIPPDATFESLKDRIGQALVNQQRQSQMQKVVADLQKQANLKLDLPQPRIQVAAEGPTRGPKDAPVTIVEFSDFECPYCGAAHDTVEQVMNSYAGKVRLVYRQFPLSFHPHAAKAAEASLCAADQGKFWEYHDVLFKNQKKLEPTELKAHASEVGLDGQKFGQCLDSGDKKKAVDADQQAGLQAGVGGTPAFFINGIFLNGAQPIDEFKKVIDGELASK
ncbi:MAG TPA: thioredoxin domain-containing protein [Myxococcaceae bacterium]|nr:thioredoxin domain-containing protein [Myxococcaceae bacterium]